MKKHPLLSAIGGFIVGFACAALWLQRGESGEARELEISGTPDRTAPPAPKRDRFVKAPHERKAEIETSPRSEVAGDMTPEEQLALKEIAQRVRAGEFILHKDNPYMLRKEAEMLQQAMETVLPPLMNARQEYLSTLQVAPETITKLTNHAARLAEASLAVGPRLAEISTAKVEYDLKARELLSPEQYEKLKSFETREALEKEWQRFGVQDTAQYSLSDLTAIARSLEEMGIRERTSSSVLPYEGEPSSGNWITGTERDIKEIIRRKISRLEAAAADVPALAERNQLSLEARQALASMIATRTTALQGQLGRTLSDQEHNARFRTMIESRPPGNTR